MIKCVIIQKVPTNIGLYLQKNQAAKQKKRHVPFGIVRNF